MTFSFTLQFLLMVMEFENCLNGFEGFWGTCGVLGGVLGGSIFRWVLGKAFELLSYQKAQFLNLFLKENLKILRKLEIFDKKLVQFLLLWPNSPRIQNYKSGKAPRKLKSFFKKSTSANCKSTHSSILS